MNQNENQNETQNENNINIVKKGLKDNYVIKTITDTMSETNEYQNEHEYGNGDMNETATPIVLTLKERLAEKKRLAEVKRMEELQKLREKQENEERQEHLEMLRDAIKSGECDYQKNHEYGNGDITEEDYEYSIYPQNEDGWSLRLY